MPTVTLTGQEAYNRITSAACDAVNAARERDLDRHDSYRAFLDVVIETLNDLGVPWQ